MYVCVRERVCVTCCLASASRRLRSSILWASASTSHVSDCTLALATCDRFRQASAKAARGTMRGTCIACELPVEGKWEGLVHRFPVIHETKNKHGTTHIQLLALVVQLGGCL